MPMFAHHSAVCIVQSIERIKDVYALPPDHLYEEKPFGKKPANDHEYYIRNGLPEAVAKLTSASIRNLIVALIDAWPGAPAVDQSFLQQEHFARHIDRGAFVKVSDANPPTITVTRTAGEWEDRVTAISGVPDQHFADDVGKVLVIANPAWL
jgi:hypothetical protein